MILTKILLLLYFILKVDSANILGIFNFPSRSHHILGSSLLQSLAKKGHNVTMISPFPLKTKIKNYEDIEIESTVLTKLTNEEKFYDAILEDHESSYIDTIMHMINFLGDANEAFLNDQVMKDFLSSDRQYDIVIYAWTLNSAHLGISHHFGAASILFSTIGSSIMTNGVAGNSAAYSYVPNFILSYSDEMNFMQRVKNTVCTITYDIINYLYILPNQERVLRKYFPNAPPVEDLLGNVSLTFLNSHYSIETTKPLVPNMIQIGGFHVEDGKGLPKDIKDFIDGAPNGVLYFSLGSNAKSAYLPPKILESIVKTFSKLPLKILWKFETENIPNLPSNVVINPWLPQRDILAHPNLKVFVSHGGLLSITEAIHYGVPVVGIPLFGDQETNVNDGVVGGYVIKLSLRNFTEASFTECILEALNNPRYRKNIQQRSKILRDQPLKPLDNALFWVDYVLRHNGAHHLKPAAVKLEWYRYYLLDVLLFLLSAFVLLGLTIFYSIYKIIQIFQNCFKKPSSDKVKSKKLKKS